MYFLTPANEVCEGYVFTGVCLSTGGGCAIPACIAGGIPACLAAGVQGGWYPSMPCRFPGSHPRGKFRGIWPGGSPGPHPRGKLRGIWSRPTPKGPGGFLLLGRCLLGGGCLLQGVWGPPVTATAEGGTYPTGMHSCSWKHSQQILT